MTVHRGRGLSSEDRYAPKVLLGAAAVGGAALFYEMLRRPPAMPTPGTIKGLGAASCPQPSAAPGSAFPDDSQLITMGMCVGQTQLAGSSIYQEITSAIEQGFVNGAIVATTIEMASTGAVEAAALLGGSTFLGTAAVAAAAAAPYIGIAIGVCVGLQALFSSGPQIFVPSSSGGTEQIDLQWYMGPADNGNPGWVPNAINWLNDPSNVQQALTMTVLDFMRQHNVLNGRNDPVYGPLYIFDTVWAGDALDSTPTAYQMLKQVQLPAAAAVIQAAPGLLMQLTNGTGPGGQFPLMVQFPALTQGDMNTLQNDTNLRGLYQGVINQASTYAQNKINWPIDGQSFMNEFRLSATDAYSILNQYAPGQFTFPFNVGNGVLTLPGGGTMKIGNGPSPFPSTTTAAGHVAKTGALVAGGLGVGLLAYKLYTGYSFAKTTRELWRDVKKGASKVKQEAEKVIHYHHHRGRKRNPLDRSLATGGRIVAYRIRMEEDVVEFGGDTATLYRNDTAVAVFKPSAFQRTKIRSGHGEVLVFQDQLR